MKKNGLKKERQGNRALKLYRDTFALPQTHTYTHAALASIQLFTLKRERRMQKSLDETFLFRGYAVPVFKYAA